MTNAYGHKFVTNFGVKDNGVWFDALKDLTPDDLSFGFNKLLHSGNDTDGSPHESWPPTVKEFRKYCIRVHRDFDLVIASVAFKEVENNRYATTIWSHPLVCLVAHELGNLRSDERNDLFYEEFVNLYNNVTQRYMRGEKIPISEAVLMSKYYKRWKSIIVTESPGQTTLQFKQA